MTREEELLKEFETLVKAWCTKKSKSVLSEQSIQEIMELLRHPSPLYVSVEAGERNFIVAKRIIGHRAAYTQIASCRSRNQTERLVKILNQSEEPAPVRTGE